MNKFNILRSLNELVQGARFKGAIKEHTEEEYNNIIQLDPRPKPPQTEIFVQALKCLRQSIMVDINRRTDEIIEFDMLQQDGTTYVPVHLGIEEQINLDTMDRLRDELHALGEIVFPYELKVSDNEDGEGNYVKLMSADHLHMFFLMGVKHKNQTIGSGRYLKDLLGNMTKTQLEEYIDPR